MSALWQVTCTFCWALLEISPSMLQQTHKIVDLKTHSSKVCRVHLKHSITCNILCLVAGFQYGICRKCAIYLLACYHGPNVTRPWKSF
ncbi:hypothetical protein GDO78_005547 [Eleutherodactylus coqui]|uniref:Uncharacterized protein n=1 Tax=Eleutherodactylus coqui TaxID=57060 RepID=A0A8J6KEV6_ELECQ|nr:hypothetical protein GDO78_005547 [Eleutherodactylus coqui]